jgi:hypothetical protein
MLDFVPQVRSHREFEDGRNVPCKYAHCSGKPADHRLSYNVSNSPDPWTLEKRHQKLSDEVLRKSISERCDRPSQQNQWSTYRHEEKMLHHVDRKQFMITIRKRRPDCQPH